MSANDERIATGLSAIRALADGDDAWSAYRLEFGDRSIDALGFQMNALLEAIPDNTVYRNAYRGQLSTLIAVVLEHRTVWGTVPESIAVAARACRGPVPLGGSNTPSARAPEPPPGHFAPARALSIGGGVTDRYPGSDDRIQAELEWIQDRSRAQVVFAIDKNGQLFGAAGDTDEIDTVKLAARLAEASGGELATLCETRELSTHFDPASGSNMHVALVGEHLIVVVIFDSGTSVGLVRLSVKKASKRITDIVEEHPGGAPGPITLADFGSLFGPFRSASDDEDE